MYDYEFEMKIQYNSLFYEQLSNHQTFLNINFYNRLFVLFRKLRVF